MDTFLFSKWKAVFPWGAQNSKLGRLNEWKWKNWSDNLWQIQLKSPLFKGDLIKSKQQPQFCWKNYQQLPTTTNYQQCIHDCISRVHPSQLVTKQVGEWASNTKAGAKQGTHLQYSPMRRDPLPTPSDQNSAKSEKMITSKDELLAAGQSKNCFFIFFSQIRIRNFLF